MTMETIETDVLVVGAGPAGLATAIELGSRGVRVQVVERNDRAGTAPRAKTTNARTRAHLRRWGIADRLAEEAPFGVDYPNNMVFVTRLAGHELARFANAFNASPARDPRYPEHGQWVPQYTLEKVLLEKARSLPGVEVRFDTPLAGATDRGEFVAATLSSKAGDIAVRARWLVGADGARSMVRDLIGATMQGRRGLAHAYNVIFRAPALAAAHAHGPAAIYWQVSNAGFSAVGPMDRNDTWFFAPAGMPEGRVLSDAEAAAMIRARTGIDVPIEILSADQWVANDLQADSYRKGRLVLVGDACHVHPPAGGYGMNMGVGDAVDLGWKLAAILQGWGGSALVDSYAVERAPVHRAVIDEALANFSSYLARIPPEIEDDSPAGQAAREQIAAAIRADKGREFNTLGTVLGLGYEGSPLVASEPGTASPRDSETYVPSARPGQLAPHAWLGDGRSLYDLFGPGFTLLVAEDADPREIDRAVAQARQTGVPLSVARAPDVSVRALYEAALALIRPDQYVAWRGEAWDRTALKRAVGQ